MQWVDIHGQLLEDRLKYVKYNCYAYQEVIANISLLLLAHAYAKHRLICCIRQKLN